MPLIKSAVKRMKQTAKRRQRNIGIKRDIKSATKEFMSNPSADTLSKAQSELDTAVKKGLLKKATVSRRKAALAKAQQAADDKTSDNNAKPAKTSKKAKKQVNKKN